MATRTWGRSSRAHYRLNKRDGLAACGLLLIGTVFYGFALTHTVNPLLRCAINLDPTISMADAGVATAELVQPPHDRLPQTCVPRKIGAVRCGEASGE